MRVGFIGLGAMGAPMARNLHRAGLLQGVWNRTASKATALATELGCAAAATPAQLALECQVLVMCVSADLDVRAIVDELRPVMQRGQILIDCSTVSADTARHAAAVLGPSGAEVLDCPVSGGVEGASKGTLAIMVGGEAATLERALPILKALGTTITHFGGHGAGQAAKATNQIISQFADGKKVLYIDFGDKLLQPDGTISKDMLYDFTHPTAKGFQIWADAIQPTIDRFFPPVTASAPPAQPPTP